MKSKFDKIIHAYVKAWKEALECKHYKENYNTTKWLMYNKVHPIGLLKYFDIDSTKPCKEKIELLFTKIAGCKSFSELASLQNQEMGLAKKLFNRCNDVTVLKLWVCYVKDLTGKEYNNIDLSKKLKLVENFFPSNSLIKTIKRSQEQKITKFHADSYNDTLSLYDLYDAEPDYAHWKYD